MFEAETKQFLAQYVPWWMARTYKASRDLITPGPFVSFDKMFPGVEKMYHVPPAVYSTEEAARMPMYHRYRDLQRRVCVTHEDYVAEVSDVFLCPQNNVVLDRSRRVLSESVDIQLVAPLPTNGRVRELAGYWTLLRSPKARFHYHRTIDCMPRLLALNRPPYSELPEIQLFCPGKATAYERHLVSLLAPKNATLVEVSAEGLYDPEHLIFTPFKTRGALSYLPPYYASQYRASVLPKRRSRRSHRLFISRSNAGYRRMDNESELFDGLRSFGFELIRPEELGPQEQIELYYDAEVILGTHGAAMSNIIFSDHVQLVELFPTSFVSPHFYFLAKSLGHSHHYLLGDGHDRFVKSSPVDVTSVLKLLQRILP